MIEQYHRGSNIVADVREGLKPEPPEDAMDGSWRIVGDVDLDGSTEAAEKAQMVYFALCEEVYGPRNPTSKTPTVISRRGTPQRVRGRSPRRPGAPSALAPAPVHRDRRRAGGVAVPRRRVSAARHSRCP